VSKYDQKVVLEALHQLHSPIQDYRQNQGSIVTERPDRCVLENAGRFMRVAEDIMCAATRRQEGIATYLVQAMVRAETDQNQMGYRHSSGCMEIRKRKPYLADARITWCRGCCVMTVLWCGWFDPAYTRC